MKFFRFLPLIFVVLWFLGSPIVSLVLLTREYGHTYLYDQFFPLWMASVGLAIPTLIISWKYLSFNDDFTRSRRMMIFIPLIFTFYSYYAVSVYVNMFHDYVGLVWIGRGVFLYFHFCVLAQSIMLSQCRLRGKPYKVMISFPASIMFTFVLLGSLQLFFLPLIPAYYRFIPLLLPFFLSFVGLYQTQQTRSHKNYDIVDIYMKPQGTGNTVQRPNYRKINHSLYNSQNEPFTFVQITDPHLGPMMSVERLQEVCRNAVKMNPHMVFITGDLFTPEAYSNPNILYEAFSPLKPLADRNRVFACLGNHDYEGVALDMTKDGFQQLGIRLLVDESDTIEIEGIGTIQIVGFGFTFNFKKRKESVEVVCRNTPRIEGAKRVFLLHDPGCFKFVPTDQEALVLSGHTHGGALGLRSLGIDFSLVKLSGVPDAGIFVCGSNTLYVHSGQGSRSLMGNMVLKLGVPTEDSLMRVHY
eukprot:TRINITY_DN254_c0_g1_i4.p1 TRINITY_DN254_c0_g1~~TRINITY_DN254_c0_g1_i4.p1  ORF type:complete len:470 (+),score=52.01 TRINITY_DN254_c0_g1_i4:503-1912(+)